MSKKEVEITEKQKKKIPQYVDVFTKFAMNTQPVDRAKAEAAVRNLYRVAGYGEIEQFHWVGNPIEGCKLAAQFKKETVTQDPNVARTLTVTREEMREQSGAASYGSLEAYWVAYYSFLYHEVDVEKHPLVPALEDVVKECGAFWAFSKHVVMCDRPTLLEMKDGVLEGTPALQYADGFVVYAKDGKVYTSELELKIEEKFGEGKFGGAKEG
jgi:hypothetical protein